MRNCPPARYFCLGLLILVTALALAVGAAAQEAKPAVRIAVVDLEAVGAQFTRLALKREEIQQWFKQQEAYLQDLQNNYVYLTEAPFNEILDVLHMPRPLPPKPAKRQRELRKLNEEKEDRFLELQAKVDRTPQEQEEFNALQELAQARSKQIAGIAQDVRTQFMDRRKLAEDELNQALHTAVAEVAADAGYHLVLNKLAVVYGGEDITQAVLDKLNGRAPAGGAQ
jgi:Skp family chaperone for outer membrane proteins